MMTCPDFVCINQDMCSSVVQLKCQRQSNPNMWYSSSSQLRWHDFHVSPGRVRLYVIKDAVNIDGLA